MRPITRRDALVRLGTASAGLALLPTTGLRASQTQPAAGLDALVEQLRSTPRSALIAVVTDAKRSGVPPAALLDAVFLAGVRDLRPRPVGDDLHAVLMTESVYQLAARGDDEQAWLAALWNLDAYLGARERDRDRGWRLSPTPPVAFAEEARARRELLAALDDWDAERADRAIVSLLPHHDHGSMFEILWPYASRCIAYLGHKVIFVAQTERVLRRLGWRHAEPCLRSLVHGLTGRNSPADSAAYPRSLELAAGLPTDWDQGEPAPERSGPLMRELRGASPSRAQDLVVAALADGLSTDTVWDGLRLFASELCVRRRSHSPSSGAAIRAVHTVTEIQAFGHAWETTRRDGTRRILIVQAAAYLAAMRDHLLSRDAIEMDGPGLDARPVGPPPDSLAALWDDATPAAAHALLERSPALADRYLAELRRELYGKATEDHQYKYLSAIEEDLGRTDPRWHAALLAPAIPYVPTRGTPEGAPQREWAAALRSTARG